MIIRDERGFTAMELLVASTLFIIILGATLKPLDTFWTTTKRTTDQSESQEEGRRTLNRLATELRSVSGQSQLIEKAGATDIVFKTTESRSDPSGSNVGNEKRVRYCLAGTTLVRQEETWTTATPPALPSTAACPGASPWATNNPPATWEPVATSVANGATPIFTYDSGTAATVRQVTVDLLIDTTPAGLPKAAELTTSITLRNIQQVPVSSFTATAMGSLNVNLDGTGSYDPEGTALTYRWCLTSGCAAGAAIGTSATLSYTAPSAGSRTFYLQVWDAGGSVAESSKTVNVT